MKKIIWGAAWLVITIGLASAAVMLLWNCIAVDVFGLAAINYEQRTARFAPTFAAAEKLRPQPCGR